MSFSKFLIWQCELANYTFLRCPTAKFPIPFVGEFRKTCHPRNVEVYEICEMSFQEHRIREDLESRTREAPKSRTCEDLESRTCEASKSRTREDLESRTCEASKSRIREDPKSRTCKITKSGVCEIRESTRGQVQKSWRAKIS
jgi:hypothetical protein